MTVGQRGTRDKQALDKPGENCGDPSPFSPLSVSSKKPMNGILFPPPPPSSSLSYRNSAIIPKFNSIVGRNHCDRFNGKVRENTEYTVLIFYSQK